MPRRYSNEFGPQWTEIGCSHLDSNTTSEHHKWEEKLMLYAKQSMENHGDQLPKKCAIELKETSLRLTYRFSNEFNTTTQKCNLTDIETLARPTDFDLINQCIVLYTSNPAVLQIQRDRWLSPGGNSWVVSLVWSSAKNSTRSIHRILPHAKKCFQQQ